MDWKRNETLQGLLFRFPTCSLFLNRGERTKRGSFILADNRGAQGKRTRVEVYCLHRECPAPCAKPKTHFHWGVGKPEVALRRCNVSVYGVENHGEALA